MSNRTIQQYWPAQTTRDGAGVTLKRALGANPRKRMSPFLMLDHFSSDNPADYIAGFPPHPHRGFETITYIVDGHMRHRDHLGNEGDLLAGGVQWMCAGRGIIHEEMPQQTDGLLSGFQLWLNLPAKDKMKKAYYKDIPAEAMPWQPMENEGQIKWIAGHMENGQMQGDQSRITTPVIADMALPEGTQESWALPRHHSALIYVFKGQISIGNQTLDTAHIGLLNEGDKVTINATQDTRLLWASGTPLNEPVAQYGPFVMNTQAQVDQAVRDYQNGTLTG